MVSLVYHNAISRAITGTIDFDTDTFRIMLVTATYSPNKDTHDFRDDVTNEVSGTGYTAGGVVVTATPSIDTTNDRVEVTFGSVNWPSSTITARAGVIYKSRGGAASADELVAYVDFGGDVTSTNGTFTVTFTSPLRFQN